MERHLDRGRAAIKDVIEGLKKDEEADKEQVTSFVQLKFTSKIDHDFIKKNQRSRKTKA